MPEAAVSGMNNSNRAADSTIGAATSAEVTRTIEEVPGLLIVAINIHIKIVLIVATTAKTGCTRK